MAMLMFMWRLFSCSAVFIQEKKIKEMINRSLMMIDNKMKAVVILSIIANVLWVEYGRKLARVIGIQLYVLFARTVTAKPRVLLVQVGVASWKAVLVVSAATERINALQAQP